MRIKDGLLQVAMQVGGVGGQAIAAFNDPVPFALSLSLSSFTCD